MAIIKLATSQSFVKFPMHVEEATAEGTTPDSANFVSCGYVESVGLNIDDQYAEIPQIGKEDIAALVQGGIIYEGSMKLYLTALTFLNYLFNPANEASPANNIARTLTVLFSQYVNGVETYTIFKGWRCKNVTVSGEVGGAIEVTVDFVFDALVTATAHGLTTPVFASAPSGAVWGWLDGGASPITYGGSSTGLNVRSASISVNRNTKGEHALGQAEPIGNKYHGRRIGGDLTNHWTKVAIVNAKDLEALTKTPEASAQSLAWVLKSAAGTLTVTDAKFVTYKRDQSGASGDSVLESAGIKGTAVAVA